MNTPAALLLAVTALPLAADEFSHWTWRNPKPTGNILHAVTHAEDLFVAVGLYGSIVTSPDGTEWTLETSGTTAGLHGVNHGGGRFVAFGKDATLAASPDGHAWTLPDHNLANSLKGMAYGAGIWCALDDYGNIYSSAELTTWTVRVPSAYAGFNDMIFAQDKFVAVGLPGVIMTSTNGVNWVSQDSGTAAQLNDIAYCNGRFVAVGNSDEVAGEGIILTSLDAEDWLIQFTDLPLYGVGCGPNGFTAVGSNGFGLNCGRSLNSADGLYFEPGPEGCGSGLTATPNDVTCNDEVCVAVGYDGLIATTENGLTWTGVQQGTVAGLVSVAASSQRIVVTGGSGAILVSADGQAFTNRGRPGIWKAVASDGTGFVTVGSDGRILESADGDSWTEVPSPTSSDLTFVTHGSPGWLGAAYGNTGDLIRKPVGGGWELLTPATTARILYLGYSPRLNRYVAGSDTGRIGYSENGEEWDWLTILASRRVLGFAESTERFVVVTAGGAFSSTNGQQWAPIELAPTPAWIGIVHANGVFVAGGGLPDNLAFSTDGLHWMHRTVNVEGMPDLGYFKGSFYSIGAGGMILQSASATVPEFVSITPVSNALDFELFGEIGRDYELQSSTNLTDWDHEQDYTQSMRAQPLTLPADQDRRFYRSKLK